MNRRQSVLVAAGWMAAAGVWAFSALAVFSFNATDWPSHAIYPHPATANMCGTIGAWIAYVLISTVGPGVVPLLLGTGGVIALRVYGRKVDDLWFRAGGVLSLTLAVAAASTHFGFGNFGLPEGEGGLLGIASSRAAESAFGTAGLRLSIAFAAIAGLLLAADELIIGLPKKWLAGDDESSDNKTSAGERSGERVVLRQPAKPARPAVQLKLPKWKLPAFKLPTLPRIQLVSSETAEGEDEASKKGPVFRHHRKLVTVDDDGPAPEEPPVENELSEDMALEDAAEEDYEVDGEDEGDEIEAEAEEVEPAATETDVDQAEPGKRDLSKIKVTLPGMMKKKRSAPPPPKELGEYELPDWEVLEDAESGFAEQQEEYVREKAAQLEEAFEEFGVNAHVEAIETGPVITMYEIGVAKGTKVSQITGLSNDLARTLAAESVRVVAPIPGKNTIGIEVPNAEKEKVRLKDLMQLAPQKVEKMHIPLYLGKDSSGAPLITDLAGMPHCLIAGTTGSGKSVCINTIIMSIMYTQRPDRVKLVLVDPKVVEMAPFKDIPHLMCPVITDAAKANSVLEWACTKMDERYELLAEAGCRNIASYNSMTMEELIERFEPSTPEEEAKIPKKMPYMVIIIDELADLMMTAGKEVESHIVRIAQKARAVGIHLILATQRPQANVVTGLIKSNMPSKIAFRVASKMDSRIVLDQNGAELLLGQGDMLFLPPGASKPMRSQGTFIDDIEIRSSVKKVKDLAEAQYEPELVQIKNGITVGGDEERDELYEDAVRVVLETRRGSVSLLQRRLTIGYARASRMIEQMAADGIVGDYKGSQAREATLTIEEWEQLKAAQEEGAELYVDAEMDEEDAEFAEAESEEEYDEDGDDAEFEDSAEDEDEDGDDDADELVSEDDEFEDGSDEESDDESEEESDDAEAYDEAYDDAAEDDDEDVSYKDNSVAA